MENKLNLLFSIVIFLFVIGLIIFLFVIFNSGIKDATAITTQYQQNATSWYNNSYAYRFLVTNVSGDKTVLNVNYQTGMASNFNDLIAVAYDDATPLTLAINSYTLNTIANINVTLSPSLNKTFYIYYGL